MKERLNWYEVQQLVRTIKDKLSYLQFKAEMKWRIGALESQINLAKWAMKESQRKCVVDSCKHNRIEMSQFQNTRRYLRMEARVIHAALTTGKERAIKLANAQPKT